MNNVTKPIDFLYRRFNRCWKADDMHRISSLMVTEAERVYKAESAQESDRVMNIMERVLVGLKSL
tara:strand:- start:207 stop:401 length:195 start_codon:yes stop_codon:yes gene_type:complete